MTIREITEYLTRVSLSNKTPFGDIQTVRKKYSGINPNPKKPFSKDSTNESGWYAFHSGGRKEFQFNIGSDEHEGKEVFRYGLAFSLEPNINLTNPINWFHDQRQRFNSYVKNNQDFFSDMSMWHWYKKSKTRYIEVSPISDDYDKRPLSKFTTDIARQIGLINTN